MVRKKVKIMVEKETVTYERKGDADMALSSTKRASALKPDNDDISG